VLAHFNLPTASGGGAIRQGGACVRVPYLALWM